MEVAFMQITILIFTILIFMSFWGFLIIGAYLTYKEQKGKNVNIQGKKSQKILFSERNKKNKK